MIRPDKYTDFDKSVLCVASKIVLELSKVKTVSMADFNGLVSPFIDGFSTTCTEALWLLFCLGVISYDKNNKIFRICREID